MQQASQQNVPFPITCPICHKPQERLVKSFDKELDQPLLESLEVKGAGWTPDLGVCTNCLDVSQQALLQDLLEVKAGGSAGFRVLPTPLRMNAHPNYTGNGTTICLIDSGFYIHPDLEFPKNRIKKIIDITRAEQNMDYFREPNSNAWHGTMTSVVCAGNGYLSDGFYRGMASDAELVLLKVMDDDGRISRENIVKALRWVLMSYKKYDIRIVNLSVTDDEPVSFKESKISQTIKELYRQGVVVVAAAGNDPNAPVLPPASTPEALAVGGLNDRNTLDPMQLGLYHSTFGWTVDGLLKPELIAPAIFLAAPILPQTEAHLAAIELFRQFKEAEDSTEKASILEAIRSRKLLSPHYQHADGTSFAAPIVCSVIAQMLEANPLLSPEMIWEILLTTARPLPYEDRRRQGYGVIQAGHAVLKAGREQHQHLPWGKTSPSIDHVNKKVHFHFHRHAAKRVAVSGDFNGWSADANPMEKRKEAEGIWQLSLPLPSSGFYQYKFVVDGQEWVTDPMNFYREPDGYNGFNSRFLV